MNYNQCLYKLNIPGFSWHTKSTRTGCWCIIVIHNNLRTMHNQSYLPTCEINSSWTIHSAHEHTPLLPFQVLIPTMHLVNQCTLNTVETLIIVRLNIQDLLIKDHFHRHSNQNHNSAFPPVYLVLGLLVFADNLISRISWPMKFTKN